MPEAIENLIDYLHYLKECGERSVELDAETLELLKGASSAPASSASASSAPVSSALAPVRGGDTPSVANSASSTIRDFAFVGETEGFASERKAHAAMFKKMIASMGYALDEVLLTNICRGRNSEEPPSEAEVKAALPAFNEFLDANPVKAIIVFGQTAAKALFGQADISAIHGRKLSYRGIPAIPTYHPAYMAKIGPAVKMQAYHDFCVAMKTIGRSIPEVFRKYQ